MIQSDTIILETDGMVVGQINGLAVINAGPLTYGVPAGERVDGQFLEGTVLRKAVDRAEEFWRRTLQSPQQLASVETTVPDDDEIVMPSEPEP